MPSGLLDSEMLFYYESALITLESRFAVMQKQSVIREKRDIIKSIHSRIKTEESIREKLLRKHLPQSIEAIQEHLFDIAGIRVVVGFIDDVYHIAHALKEQDDIKVVSEKDYIKNPKPNGYRSYHMVVNLPVLHTKGTCRVNAEIQLRTIAMDFWASLEHEMKYKKDIQNQQMICAELKRCADEMASADVDMQAIREMIVEGDQR